MKELDYKRLKQELLAELKEFSPKTETEGAKLLLIAIAKNGEMCIGTPFGSVGHGTPQQADVVHEIFGLAEFMNGGIGT